jgi:8-oxo-dGTP pyrophosphatase MutT (NUDIX family)
MAKETHEAKLARWAKGGKVGSEPIAAATVILVRDADSGIETLMLHRNSKIAFGGMWVFPGGRVDDADREGLAPDDELGAALRGAVREALEESGLVVAPEATLPYSHWSPPAITPRRFLTWFFIAEAPAGAVEIDQGEIHDHEWMRPADALSRRDAREIELAPPTVVTLHELSGHRRVSDALDASAGRSPERFATRISVTDDGPVALWHGDAGYESSEADTPGPRHRLRMSASQWRYERDTARD